MAKIIRKSRQAKERAATIFLRLQEAYPNVRCTLDYKDSFQLLIMTILAAQCTDARVNIVCRDLFQIYKTPKDFANAAPGTLEKAIHSCGFFNQKARSIRQSSTLLLKEYDGMVPENMEDLLRLPGVGRKIANVVRAECFGKSSVIVDTHCKRLSNRLGFTKHTDPTHIEQDLLALWKKEHCTLFSHFMVFHGRAVCQARSPQCTSCVVADLCSRANFPKKVRK